MFVNGARWCALPYNPAVQNHKPTNRARHEGRCVHCLRIVAPITEDHLFPRSWYPETTPPNLAKWKFPACLECNRAYGRLEEQLRLLLAACTDPKGDSSAGIWRKAYDSISPHKARGPLDAIKRKSASKRFLQRLREVDSSAPGQLPEIHTRRPRGDLALLVPADDLHRFIEKLIRGTIFLTEGRYIENDQEITVSILGPEDGDPIVALLDRSGELHERGPGIRIRKAAAVDAPTNSLFVFDIWGSVSLSWCRLGSHALTRRAEGPVSTKVDVPLGVPPPKGRSISEQRVYTAQFV